MQNLNQRNDQQKRDLKDKQREARKQHIGGLVVAYHARTLGSEVHWEWSRRCRAWKWKLIDNMRQHMKTQTAVVGGCRVGLVDERTGKVVGKEWRVETTNGDFAQRIHIPCLKEACQKEHTPCEGRLTRQSAFYPQQMARHVIHHMKNSCHGVEDMGGLFMKGAHQTHDYQPGQCNCRWFRDGGLMQVCPKCQLSWEPPKSVKGSHEVFVGDDGDNPEGMEEDNPENPEQRHDPEDPGNVWDEREKKDWERKLKLIHSATGHGSVASLVDALKKRGAAPKVIQLAREFVCDVCEERKRPNPRRVSTWEVIPKRWRVVLVDCAVWRHPKTGKRAVIGLCMDQGSRFLVGKVLVEHTTQNPNAEQYQKFFEEHWEPYFGVPEVLRCDAEGTWRSRKLDEAFAKKNVYMDTIPGDAHWHLSPLERSVGWIKEFLSKQIHEQADMTTTSALAAAIFAWNQREPVRGFSPFQHALGQAPDLDGRFFETPVGGLPVGAMENPEGELAQRQNLRLQAEEKFVRWQAKDRVDRALNSKGRKLPEFFPGDLVFSWRSCIKKNQDGTRIQTGTVGGYAGPARILALETRHDDDGKLKGSSVVWLVRNNRLLKASIQQLRRASQRETVMHELERPPELPWTMTELAKPLGREEFDDISNEAMPAHVEDETPRYWVEPPAKRLRKKTADSVFRPQASEAASSSAGRVRREPQQHRTDPYPSLLAEQEQHTAYWADETAAISIELALPQSRNGWKQMAKDPQAYLASMMKRKAVEVHERHMDEDTKSKFREAKQTEMNKFLKSEAIEALPPHLQPSRQQAMQMRWLLTWKVDGDGKTVPKARIVILGYQDPAYEHRVTYAPTTTRHTRQTMLQFAASQGWWAWKGDVAAAFLQGRECKEDLFCIPTPELCELLQIPKESVAKLRKTCYGLVQAPYEWYETVKEYLLSIGYTQLGSDPCAWVLKQKGKVHAVISGHVDDFMFVADPQDPIWLESKREIQNHFRWGEFEENRFTQCGVQIARQDDGSFHLSQERYMEHVKEIPMSQERRRDRKSPTTEHEKTLLRGILGAMSWHCSQVGFRFSAYVSLSLSEVPISTVEHVLQANSLLYKMKGASHEPLRIHPIPLDEVEMFAWSDASSQNRQGGYSTKGIFVGAASKKLNEGEVAQVSPMFWQSSKITRVCRAPGAAEARAIVDAEDILYLIRYQWAELLGYSPCLRDPDAMVAKVKGTLITDSRSVYDKLQRPYISPTGESKRIDIELLAVKESEMYTQLQVRWVNSEAMLANSLTKRGEDHQMQRYVACRQVWRVVEDPEMFSGKKLKQQKRDLLDIEKAAGNPKDSEVTNANV